MKTVFIICVVIVNIIFFLIGRITAKWSPVTKGRKPLGWWYYKWIAEIGYYFKGSSSSMYYDNLTKMYRKYRLNLYGEYI